MQFLARLELLYHFFAKRSSRVRISRVGLVRSVGLGLGLGLGLYAGLDSTEEEC